MDKLSKEYTFLLDEIARELDISPSKYEQAVERYSSVGEWLGEGDYGHCYDGPDVYPQGSFRMGTVVRPFIDGAEADYDIDLVFELKKRVDETTPREVRQQVGDRLKYHGIYKQLLKPESRRCWTLEYAEEDGVGFHLDVLMAVPKSIGNDAVSITHRNEDCSYEWASSNPKGYAEWFEEKNQVAYAAVEKLQKDFILEGYEGLYANIDEVPDQLVKTPLQRSIQILKRHRDQRFSGHPYEDAKPISMIITTLAAMLYGNEATTFEALTNIVQQLDAHASLIDHGFALESMQAKRDLVIKTDDGKWIIPNPVDPDENFADRWHENDHEKAKYFFQWVKWVRQDLMDILGEQSISEISEAVSPYLGERAVKAASVRVASIGAPTMIAGNAVDDDYPNVDINDPAKPWYDG
ncbi:nucleotidyltransferase [Maridesulfovibrio sp.]|uniref:nucleotidyltransferase domain-containing protein n=1 Tax=Maridesulfovibrio sp. TaxID=2795000 RepID=UPI002AA61B09|nr:nucleotidyltransferase [Maridesulfovibrio sp.]